MNWILVVTLFTYGGNVTVQTMQFEKFEHCTAAQNTFKLSYTGVYTSAGFAACLLDKDYKGKRSESTTK